MPRHVTVGMKLRSESESGTHWHAQAPADATLETEEASAPIEDPEVRGDVVTDQGSPSAVPNKGRGFSCNGNTRLRLSAMIVDHSRCGQGRDSTRV
eukprot:2765393-Rhodomonas_salina.2